MRGNDRPLRWPLAVAVTGTTIVVVSLGSMLLRGRPVEAFYAHWLFHNSPTSVIAVWLGWLVLRRQPRHRAGLLLLVVGAFSCAHVGMITLADARFVAAGAAQAGGTFTPFVPAATPLDATVPHWFSTWLWLPALGLTLTLLLLVFPDGHLPGRRWRWVAPVAVAGIGVLVVAYGIEAWPRATYAIAFGDQVNENPLAVRLVAIGGVAFLVAAVASVLSLVSRWREADATQRRQIRPVLAAGVLFAVVCFVTWPWQWLWAPAVLVMVWGFLAAYAFAVARYRLHDLDVVVSRAVVGAVLAAIVTAVYLAIVVGIGSLVGWGSERTLLPLLAAGAVALLFEPARQRIRQLVDRMLYGRDRNAAQALSELAGRLGQASAVDDILEDIASLLVGSTGAERAEIVMLVQDREWLAASSGTTARSAPLVSTTVAHDSETLGVLRLYARSTGDLAPDSAGLLDDVAATLGVVLRNAHLTAELRAQVDELRRSRQRLVEAHDEARRSVERDIHDGAQARLIALRIRLGVAASLAERDGTPALHRLVTELGDEVDAAVRTLRSLGHGLQPPVLEGAGVVAALRAEARNLPLDITVEAADLGRYDRAVEAAMYFSCLEAIQNATKHGRARTVQVVFTNGGSDVSFTVTDDGCGFDGDAVPAGAGLTNVRDRIGALGGHFSVDAATGRGTRVHGRLPAQPLVSER